MDQGAHNANERRATAHETQAEHEDGCAAS